ncbi:hypothetical protein SCUCBS95973_007941 [Sporothrix curviconia]|uniref:3-oxoacid CoA-transferase n=1 Tax=Sporothrix curviconia TaxID=1260050 RepID=A0ABP0CHZ1_9PEZI
MDYSKAEITLYTYFRSSCSARVRTAAALKGISMTPRYVNILQGQQSEDAYKVRINPCGTVPAIVVRLPDGIEAVIRQSAAILEFFEEAFPEKRPLLPPTGQLLQRATVRDIVNFITSDIQPKTNSSVLKRMKDFGVGSAEWCHEHMVPGLRTVNTILETSAGKHAVGDEITLADVVLAPAVEAALRWDVDVAQFPKVLQVYNACRELPEFVQADWKHQRDTPEHLRASMATAASTIVRPTPARLAPTIAAACGQRTFKNDAPTVPPPTRGGDKVYKTADDAVADIASGSVILSAGFGLSGVAETLIAALHRRGTESLNSLTAISNNAGVEGKGGLAVLTEAGQIDRLVISYLGNNKGLEKKYLTGKIAVELCPQGTLAERIRAAGSGIPAFFTPTGAHSLLQDGQIPVRLNPDGSVAEPGRARESRVFDGRTFLMEPALPGDVAILRAHRVDRAGNCVFRYSTKSFGPLMGKAAKLTIVEAENIVELGEIDPGEVDLAGIYVDRIVPATVPSKIDILKTREPESTAKSTEATKTPSAAVEKRLRIARRAAKELHPGFYVNLGVGIPTLAPSFLPPEQRVWIQSENGILGMGPYPLPDEVDPDIVNAGKETVTLVAGAATFDSSESFGMIRGGHVDVSILGALQVSATGDLANYMIPGKVFKGMGGAMDLVSNPDKTKIVVATEHVAKDGTSKIVQDCSLPLTGARVVSTIITELCVFEVDRKRGSGLTLTELAPGVTVDDVRKNTDAPFAVADSILPME